MAKKAKKKSELVKVIKTTKFAKESRAVMEAQGLDRIVYSERDFDPYTSVTPFKPKIENVKTQTIGAELQQDWLTELFADPLKPRTICISGFPSDLRAKCIAAKLLEVAIDAYKEQSMRERKGRTLPKWHRVYGNFHDQIRDAQANRLNPAMLIISNVNLESTSAKIEKVRDLVDMFPDIPRVIITGGCTPVDFFQQKIYYPLDMSFYVGPNNRVGGSSLLDL